MAILGRIRQAWNAFRTSDQLIANPPEGTGYGYSSSTSPSRPRPRFFNERTIITSIYTRIGIDIAAINIRHILLDEQDRYIENVKSSLNDCLTFQPNVDQVPRSFRQDIATVLFDSGVAAIVPVDTVIDLDNESQFDVLSMRVGTVVAWYPEHVKVSLYNEKKGVREDILLEKRLVAIVENPLYAVMNEQNSTLQRLTRKLALLDAIDEQSGSGKLDLIIQLPYVIKSEARKVQAEKRREEIEFQLKDSRYGIAYTDGTEKITQLNRPAENNLLKQVEFLTEMLYSQLGITAEVMNGTADEKTMLNYYNRTVEPILDSVVEAMQVALLGLARLKKRQRIRYFRDPFKLVPIAQIADIADKFSRNEILSANEIRGFMGVTPSKDPKADQLMNSNMPQPNGEGSPTNAAPAAPAGPSFEDMDKIISQVLDGVSSDMDKLTKV